MRHVTSLNALGFPVFILVLTGGSLLAQEATGTISGSVMDSTGASVSEASIAVRNVRTNLVRQSKTDDNGIFNVPALQPGIYNIEVSREGFKRARMGDFQVQVNQVASVNLTLEVGAVSESVTVTGGVSLLQAETSTIGNVVGTKAIEELPLNGRQFLQLMTLVPGTVGGYSRDASRQGGRRAALNVAVNGGRAEFNNYLLDGILNTDENYNTYIVSPSVDALQEFKVQTSSYSAQYGRGGAGQINIITKSGTNEIHGTAYEFLRNERLDAKNFFDVADRPIPPYRQNQFGGTLGGPLFIPKLYNGKDRTFFFVSYEGFRIHQAQTSVSTVPLPQWRTGDFSGAAPIYDPQTLRPNPANPSSFVRDPFPNNRVPSTRLDSASQYFLRFLPEPNLTGSVNNYLSNEGRRTTDDQVTVRIDHKLSDRNNLFGRYSISDEAEFRPRQFPGMGNILDVRGQLAAIGDTHVFGPSTVNEFRFGFTRFRNGLLQENANKLDAVGEAGITGLSRNPIDFGIPAISVTGITGWGDSAFAYPSLLRNNVFQFVDNLSHTRGRHNLNLGVEIRRFQFNNFANNLGRGSYSFSSPFFTGNPASPAGTGIGFADYLLGQPRSVEGSIGDTNVYMGRNSWNFYLQDDWKITRRLTLNLGVRYEYNPYPTEKFDRIATVDLSTNPPTIVRAGQGDPFFMYPTNIRLDPRIPYVRDGRLGRSLLQSDKNDLAPRFGLAYSLGASTVIRASYGIYYAQDLANIFFDMARAIPRSVRSGLSSDPMRPEINIRTAFNGLEQGASILVPTLVMVDPDYRTSYMQHWSVNIQREIGKDLVLEVGYLGNKGTKLGLLNMLNNAEAAPGAPQPRRPWPMYGSVWLFQHRTGSFYNSLQMRLEKRFTHGLSFMGSYTFGKSLDYVSSSRTGGEENHPMDPNNLALERGRSVFDARQVFTFHTLYELPFGPNKSFANYRGVAGKFLGGWQVSSILQMRTGLPFTITADGDIPNTGNGVSRANIVPGVKAALSSSERTLSRWFNTSAFVEPPLYTYGTAGRNTVDGPGRVNLDLSLIKNTVITERVTLQFRAESFNLSNTPAFDKPDALVGTPGFGRISSAGASRQVQFALRLIF
jgi:hypothetical protein